MIVYLLPSSEGFQGILRQDHASLAHLRDVIGCGRAAPLKSYPGMWMELLSSLNLQPATGFDHSTISRLRQKDLVVCVFCLAHPTAPRLLVFEPLFTLAPAPALESVRLVLDAAAPHRRSKQPLNQHPLRPSTPRLQTDESNSDGRRRRARRMIQESSSTLLPPPTAIPNG
jgi:hypothetical protein